MEVIIRPMDETAVNAIAGWHYPPPYDFNDWTKDPDDLAGILDARRWPERYFAVFDPADTLIGFYEFERREETVIIGLGLRPDLTGRGLGRAFVDAGLAFAREHFRPARFELTVATFNRRAITVYERAGFVPGERFIHRTNGGDHEFLRMHRAAGDDPAITGDPPSRDG